MRYYEMWKGRLGAIQSEFQGILDRDVSEFNRAVQAAKIPPVTAAPKLGS